MYLYVSSYDKEGRARILCQSIFLSTSTNHVMDSALKKRNNQMNTLIFYRIIRRNRWTDAMSHAARISSWSGELCSNYITSQRMLETPINREKELFRTTRSFIVTSNLRYYFLAFNISEGIKIILNVDVNNCFIYP